EKNRLCSVHRQKESLMHALEPEKKSNGCVTALAVIGALALMIVAVLIVLVVVSPNLSTGTSGSSSTHRVQYTVTTDYPVLCHGIDVTYEMAHGTAQKTVTLCDGPTSQVVDEFVGTSGDFVYLSAQNGKSYAKVTCKIYIDSHLVHQTTSQGQYVIA